MYRNTPIELLDIAPVCIEDIKIIKARMKYMQLDYIGNEWL